MMYRAIRACYAGVLVWFLGFPHTLGAQMVEVKAIDSFDAPLSGATVVIDNLQVGLPQYSLTTDAGTYSTELLQGHYSVTVNADGFRGARGTIDVPSSGAAHLTLHLEREGGGPFEGSETGYPAVVCDNDTTPCISMEAEKLVEELGRAAEELRETNTLSNVVAKLFDGRSTILLEQAAVSEVLLQKLKVAETRLVKSAFDQIEQIFSDLIGGSPPPAGWRLPLQPLHWSDTAETKVAAMRAVAEDERYVRKIQAQARDQARTTQWLQRVAPTGAVPAIVPQGGAALAVRCSGSACRDLFRVHQYGFPKN
jgi:hypothetical protein